MTIVLLSSWRDFNKILHLPNVNYADFIQRSSIFRGSTLELNLDYILYFKAAAACTQSNKVPGFTPDHYEAVSSTPTHCSTHTHLPYGTCVHELDWGNFEQLSLCCKLISKEKS